MCKHKQHTETFIGVREVQNPPSFSPPDTCLHLCQLGVMVNCPFFGNLEMTLERCGGTREEVSEIVSTILQALGWSILTP